MRYFLILISLTALWGFYGHQVAWAQGAEPSPVGVVPEVTEEPAPSRVTLKLAGSACEVNAVESAVLHLKGIVGVDIESKKDHLIVDYDPNVVTPQQMVDAMARKKGCLSHVLGAGGTGGATIK